MDEDGYSSSGVWNIRSDISLEDVVFQFNTGTNFKCDCVIGFSVALLVYIGIWNKLRIYRVPPDPVRWSCRGLGFLWRAFMFNWMLWTKNYFKVSHSNQVNDPSNMKLKTSLMNF